MRLEPSTGESALSLDGQAGRPRDGHEKLAAAVFVSFALVYLFTLSANLSVAHDSPRYAAHILSLAPSFHPNHLLYEPVLASVAWLLQQLGMPPSPRIIGATGALAGAATLAATFLTLVRRLDVPVMIAGATVAGAGFTFGVWYYSVAVEIYIYPLCFLTWSLYLLLDHRRRVAAVAAAAALQSAAVLFHQTAILFSLVPVTILMTDHRRPLGRRITLLVTYSAIGAAIVGGAYLAVAAATGHAGSAARFWTWLLGYGTQAEYWSPFGAKAVLLAGVGLARAVIGGHFAFAIPALRSRLEASFPGNSLEDEAYLVRAYAGTAAEVLLALSVCWVLVAAACSAVAAAGAARLASRGRGAPLLPLLSWLVPYTLFFIAWDASNVDFWVAQVLIGWMLLAIGLAAVCPARWAAGLLGGLAAGLLVLNGLGSIVPARDAKNDYRWTKIGVLTASMDPKGVLVIGDPWPDAQHLRLHARTISFVALVDLYRAGRPAKAFVAELRRGLAAGRPIYLWPDALAARPETLVFYGAPYQQFLNDFRSQLCGTGPLASGLGLTALEVRCLR